MKATIRDRACLQSLRPLEVAAYLRASGWRELRSTPGRSSTWFWEDCEIVVPLDPSFGDYALRMGDIFATLEAVEDRSQLEILRDLLTTSADTVRLRVRDRQASDGSIPIEEGVQIVQRARDMVMAAACSAVEPRSVYYTRKPSRASEYVRRVRMGQTEHGSYVVTVISPVPPALSSSPGQSFETEEPFERQVTHKLADSLGALKAAAEQAVATGSTDAFQSAVARGVSANLCEAIVGMSETGDANRDLEISISWSRTRPVGENVPARVLLTADAMPVIVEASRYFRETSPQEGFQLNGPVVKLERAEGAPAGTVTVLGFVDGRPRNMSFEVPDSEYTIAVRAHEEKHPIVCYGDLIREGRSLRLKNPSGLQIETDV